MRLTNAAGTQGWARPSSASTSEYYGGRIRQEARELKERQTEIALRVEQHQKGEGAFRTTLETLISVASRVAELFERSKTEQKRELLAFVFSNMRLRGKKLEFSLRPPFDLIANRTDHSSWLGREDSNLRMAESKSHNASSHGPSWVTRQLTIPVNSRFFLDAIRHSPSRYRSAVPTWRRHDAMAAGWFRESKDHEAGRR
jgi:hypothetical protein